MTLPARFARTVSATVLRYTAVVHRAACTHVPTWVAWWPATYRLLMTYRAHTVPRILRPAPRRLTTHISPTRTRFAVGLYFGAGREHTAASLPACAIPTFYTLHLHTARLLPSLFFVAPCITTYILL